MSSPESNKDYSETYNQINEEVGKLTENISDTKSKGFSIPYKSPVFLGFIIPFIIFICLLVVRPNIVTEKVEDSDKRILRIKKVLIWTFVFVTPIYIGFAIYFMKYRKSSDNSESDNTLLPQ